MSADGPPIQNLQSIDIVGAMKNGGVELWIVVSSFLDGSPESQMLLRSKLQVYVEELNTPEFQEEFEYPPPEKTIVVVACTVAPDPIIEQFIERCRPWVEENNARLEMRVEPLDKD